MAKKSADASVPVRRVRKTPGTGSPRAAAPRSGDAATQGDDAAVLTTAAPVDAPVAETTEQPARASAPEPGDAARAASGDGDRPDASTEGDAAVSKTAVKKPRAPRKASATVSAETTPVASGKRAAGKVAATKSAAASTKTTAGKTAAGKRTAGTSAAGKAASKSAAGSTASAKSQASQPAKAGKATDASRSDHASTSGVAAESTTTAAVTSTSPQTLTLAPTPASTPTPVQAQPTSATGTTTAAPRLVRKPAAVQPATGPKKREEPKPHEMSTPLPRAVEDALAKARAALDELTTPIVSKAASAPVAVAPTAPTGSTAAAAETAPTDTLPTPTEPAASTATASSTSTAAPATTPAPAATLLAATEAALELAQVSASASASGEGAPIAADDHQHEQPTSTASTAAAASLAASIAAAEPIVEDEPPAPHGDELAVALPPRQPHVASTDPIVEDEPPAPHGDALVASTSPIAEATPVSAPPAPRVAAAGAGRGADASASKSLSILMVASEAVPFAKTGGLADVAAALPIALAELGHRVTMVIPRYRGVAVSGAPRVELDITIGRETHHVKIYEVIGRAGARVWLVDEPALFDRSGIYGQNGHDHPDNPRRYALLARAAFEAAIALGFAPDIVHAHDWQGGLAPVYLKTRYATDPLLGGVPSLFTIHNIAYTGLADPGWLPALDLGWELYRTDGGLEFWQKASFLKAGINFSEKITTVSPSYARELLTPEFAFGFEGVLNRRRNDLVGILNGIDAETWNPAADPYIPAPYTAADLSGKALAKRALLRAYGLPYDDAALRAPLIGMVSRMVDQKGLDMIAQAANDLPHLGARFVVLGTGEPRYEEMWRTLAAYYPDRIAVNVGFDEPLSHLVEAGADLFLMPSHFEPCGLNQMYSLRYGTLPFVRATGGLDDTVDNYHPSTGGGNGFKFWEPSGAALVNTLRWALSVYQNREVWQRLQRAAMAADFSWTRSAQQYVALYEDVLQTAGRLAAARARGSAE